MENNKRLRDLWRGMHLRCEDEAHPSYARYGGRGISVCPSWTDFFDFKTWATASGYAPGLSLDRIDNDGNYSPENCRWVTCQEQNRNRRNNTIIEYQGERRCISEWAEILGMSKNTIRRRVLSGWPTEAILTVPPNKRNTRAGYITRHGYRTEADHDAE